MRNDLHLEATENMPCAVCEVMCMDAVDGTLDQAQQAALDRHVAGCVRCAEGLAEARRGAAWMEMLKGHTPAPPADLLQRILAETTGATTSGAAVVHAPQPAPAWLASSSTPAKQGWWANARRSFSMGGGTGFTAFQPRMAMTAAMAFFSIAITMNLGGIRVTDLRPSALHRTVADARANITRSFQNSRVVYQVESRVDELRSGNGNDDRHDPAGPFGETHDPAPAQRPAAQPNQAPQNNKPAAPNGTSELQFSAPSRSAAAQLTQVSNTRNVTQPNRASAREGV